MKKILILLGSVLFLFSTILVTASATQIPVVGEYDYGNLVRDSLLDSYEYSIYSSVFYSDGSDSTETSTLTYPLISLFKYPDETFVGKIQWDCSSLHSFSKFYLTLNVSDLSILNGYLEIGFSYTSAGNEVGNSVEIYDLTLYDQFFMNDSYYLCYSYDFEYHISCEFIYLEFHPPREVGFYDDFLSIVEFFSTSSLTYPIKESGVEIYSTPGSDQVPGTYDLKHNIYGYPWELTVEDERPQSIYFDRQQGLMIQTISYDYTEAIYIDKMKIVYFIVGDNPQFGVTVLSQDDYGSIISSVPEYTVEIGTPTPRAPVEWNGDNIMPDYYEVSIDLQGYNLADCTVTISCLVDAIEDPNPNNANRINYFYFFGNFIGYYTKDLSQAEDPNLKWVTFIGDKLDAILENFKAPPDESLDNSNNLQQETDNLHQMEEEIIGMLPSVDFNAVEGQVSALEGLQGQVKGNLILSTIAGSGPVPQLMYLGLLMGVGAVLLFINKR